MNALAPEQVPRAGRELMAGSKHDGRTVHHGDGCEGCQILGLMAEVDRLRANLGTQERVNADLKRAADAFLDERDRIRAVIEKAPHAWDCTDPDGGSFCTCWKAGALG